MHVASEWNNSFYPCDGSLTLPAPKGFGSPLSVERPWDSLPWRHPREVGESRGKNFPENQ